MTEDRRPRCHWASENDPAYLAYHDDEWGVPLREERQLFLGEGGLDEDHVQGSPLTPPNRP